MEQTQNESKSKKKNTIAWLPIPKELGKILLLGIVQGAALAAGGKLAEVSFRRRVSGDVIPMPTRKVM